jgi:hypothetical protein
MDDDARRLVDHEEVFVGVGNREFGWRDLRNRRDLECLDLDLLATGELMALAPRPPVHENGAGLEQPLGRGARPDFW